MELKLPFGLRGEKLIHISELTKEERGNKCNCICPKCKNPLIARMGDIKIHHFAHKTEDCKGGLETALHLFAKEVLERRMELVIPKGTIPFSEKITRLEDFKNVSPLMDKKEIFPAQRLKFDSVEIEKKVANIIPDIVVYQGKTPLFIEIVVTNPVNPLKQMKIEELNISTLQINIGIYVENFNEFSKEEIERLIIEETKNKTWVHKCKSRFEKPYRINTS